MPVKTPVLESTNILALYASLALSINTYGGTEIPVFEDAWQV